MKACKKNAFLLVGLATSFFSPLRNDLLAVEIPAPMLGWLTSSEPLLRWNDEEPWGAEDYGAESHTVKVPEPLLFDLVRPLGAKKGEFEFNTLAIFPFSHSNTGVGDPFGPAPNSLDRKGIEWAPEIEYAIADNFAIEFEFPLEEHVLEAYKLGLQWTLGTAFDNHYIHGIQVLIEPNAHWEEWNTTFLYLGGIRFDPTWSALIMAGYRLNLEGPDQKDSFEYLFNASLFADVTKRMSLGLETNTAIHLNGAVDFILTPQLHYEISDHIQVQTGLGFGFSDDYNESSYILRAIYSR